MKDYKVYLAGGLFSEVQIDGRWKEYHEAVKALPKAEIFSPIAAEYNQNKEALPSPADIYWGDYEQIATSKYVIFDMGDQLDPGLNLELGIIAGLNEARDQQIIPIGVFSDIRLSSANKYDYCSLGYNHMVIGAFNIYGYSVKSFKEALEYIKLLELKS